MQRLARCLAVAVALAACDGSAADPAGGDGDGALRGDGGAAAPDADLPGIVLHVRPGGEGGAFASLTDAVASIAAVDEDIEIRVHEGTYTGERIGWPESATSPDHTVTVRGAPGEAMPVFDGGGGGDFVNLYTSGQANTNLVFDHLEIARYYRPFNFSGWSGSLDTWNGGNAIRNCVLRDATARKAVILLSDTRDNVIENNVIAHYHGGGGAHAIYQTARVERSIIRNNFVLDGAGDAFRFRNGTDGGLVTGNYLDRVGTWGGATSYRCTNPGYVEAFSRGNQLEDNVFLYMFAGDSSYGAGTAFENDGCPAGGSHLVSCADCFSVDEATRRNQRLAQASSQSVRALAAGDFDGDGMAELVVSLSDSEGQTGRSLHRVVSSKLQPQYLGNVLFTSPYSRVTALAAGDFDGSGRVQLASAIQDGGGVTRVLRGPGVGTLGGDTISDDVGDGFEVSAMAAGDIDGDGHDELVIALWRASPAESRVHVGDGTSLGPRIDGSAWRVNALAIGDYDGDGDVEVAAAWRYGGASHLYKVTTGDGATSVSQATLFSSSTQQPVALAAGDLCHDGAACAGDEIAAALSDGAGVAIWRGDGTATVTGSQLHASSTDTVAALLGGALPAGKLVTAFGRPDRRFTQVVFGDGGGPTPIVGLTAHAWQPR